MASESEMSDTSLLDQLISSRNRDLSLFLPFLLGFTSSSPIRENDDPDQDAAARTHERIILINPFTQGMIVIEGGRSLDDLLRDFPRKEGPRPASKASIDAMPRVEITEEDGDGECAICLDGWEIGAEAREMPCNHRYHSNCIEKWLGIHGSCPLCRFKMPVDEDEDQNKRGSGNGGAGDEEERRGSTEREVWVRVSFNNNMRNSDSNRTNSENDSTPASEHDVVERSSNTYQGESTEEHI